MSASSPLFRFIQVELPWPLGPPDGRYLLRGRRDAVAAAAQAALGGSLDDAQRQTVTFSLGRIEAVLRARATANA